MSDSNVTKPIFEKSAKELHEVLDSGHIEDNKYVQVVLAGYREHNKVKNRELGEKKHEFSIAKAINPEDVEGLKKTLRLK